MDWNAAVDAYCERMGPGLLAEPANALTNLAFLAVAAWLWGAARGVERILVAVLFLIGIGSGLFHTVATRWAGLADVVPIAVFILVYIWAANRHMLGWGPWVSALGVLAVLPALMLAGWGLGHVPGFAISAPYWPVAGLIALYAAGLAGRAPELARGLGLGAALLALSLVARSLDGPVCALWPVGSHFVWHLLNAAMLGWMITVLRRHRAGRAGSAAAAHPSP